MMKWIRTSRFSIKNSLTLQAVQTLFLSDEFGMSDREAGLALGAKGLCASVYGLALGSDPPAQPA